MKNCAFPSLSLGTTLGFEILIGTWTTGFAQHVLGTSKPDPCWMCSSFKKCILRPRHAVFTNQRRHGQLIPKCVHFGHQERSPKPAILLRRQTPFQQNKKIGTLPGLIFKQSYFGREMVMLEKCHIPATRVRFKGFGMRAPLQFYNCRISAAKPYFRVGNVKFEIWNPKLKI